MPSRLATDILILRVPTETSNPAQMPSAPPLTLFHARRSFSPPRSRPAQWATKRPVYFNPSFPFSSKNLKTQARVLTTLYSEIHRLYPIPNLPPLHRPLPHPLTLRRPHGPPGDLGRARLRAKSRPDPLFRRLQLWNPSPRRARIVYTKPRDQTRPRRRRHHLCGTVGTAPLAPT